MNRYIITTQQERAYNAGPKARRDAEAIASRAGYQSICFKGSLTAEGSILGGITLLIRSLQNWRKLCGSVDDGGVVLIQFPLYPIKTAYVMRFMMRRVKRKKKVSFIALIHDLDSLRGLFGSAGVYNDNKVLPLFDAIICHNAAMKAYLMSHGFSEEKIVTLGIFDYLTDAGCKTHDRNDGIAFAGNLSPEKSGFLKKLNAEIAATFHLYGTGGDSFPDGAKFHGAYSPDVLPGEVEGAFGLVWDGDSTECCNGSSGDYMRYNNPHKLSMYLACGMPVIIWDRSALAGFVKEKKIGVTISSLNEIEPVNEEEYESMLENVAEVQAAVRSGKYLDTALDRAEAILTD